MKTILLLLVAVLIIDSPTDATDFIYIQNVTINPPDKPTKYGDILTNMNISDCAEACRNHSEPCKLFTYDSARQICYLSVNDSEVLSKGLIANTTTSTFLMKKYYYEMKFFVYLSVLPPWPQTVSKTQSETVEGCAHLCLQKINACHSFSYNPVNSECSLFSKSFIFNGKPLGTNLQPKSNTSFVMYFEKLVNDFYYFDPIVGFRINGSQPMPIGDEDDYPISCAGACLNDMTCKAFNFDILNIGCESSNRLDQATWSFENLIPDNNSIFFEMRIRKAHNHPILFRPKGEITSVGFPEAYPPGKPVNAFLVAPPGARLDARLTRLNLLKTKEGECVDLLKLNDVAYCNESLPKDINTTSTNTLSIEFIPRSNRSGIDVNEEATGFRVGYKWEWDCGNDDNAIVISSETDMNMLSNPGYPRVDGEINSCKWTISAANGFVYLSFAKLPSKNVLSISSGGRSINDTFKNRIYGKEVTISYTRMPGRDNAFLVYYFPVEANKTEVPVMNETSTIDLKKNDEYLLNFTNRFNHLHIRVSYFVRIENPVFGSVLTLKFKTMGFGHLDLFDECYEGFVDVFKGHVTDTNKVAPFARFCGNQPFEHLIDTRTNNITIVATLYQRKYRDGKTMILDSSERNGFSVILKSFIDVPKEMSIYPPPAPIWYPENLWRLTYGYNENLNWLINTNQSNVRVRLEFLTVRLATLPWNKDVCDNDRIYVSQIFKSSSAGHTIRKDHELCGFNRTKHQPKFFYSGQNLPMTISLISDDRHNGRGFSAYFNLVTVFEGVLSDGHSIRPVKVGENGYLISKYYPELINLGAGDNKSAMAWKMVSARYNAFNLTVEYASDDELCKNLFFFENKKSMFLDCLTPKWTKTCKNGTTIIWDASEDPMPRFAAYVNFFNVKDPQPHGKTGLTTGAVVGIVIGVLAIVIICVLVGILIYFAREGRLLNTPLGNLFHKQSTDDMTIVNNAE